MNKRILIIELTYNLNEDERNDLAIEIRRRLELDKHGHLVFIISGSTKNQVYWVGTSLVERIVNSIFMKRKLIRSIISKSVST